MIGVHRTPCHARLEADRKLDSLVLGVIARRHGEKTETIEDAIRCLARIDLREPDRITELKIKAIIPRARRLVRDVLEAERARR